MARVRRLPAALSLVIAAALAGGCSAAQATPADRSANVTVARSGWVASWGAAMQADPAAPSPAAVYTIRDVVHLSVGGSGLRLWISNAFGHTPLRLGQVTVAPAENGDRPATDGRAPQEVTFGGNAAVTVPAGEERVSDPAPLAPTAGADLLVSMYVTAPPDLPTAHVAAYTRAYLAAGGNDTGDVQGGSFTQRQDSWYFLTGVDVFDPSSPGSVVALGDSLTDGNLSTTAGNDRWPDVLARRLLAGPPDQRLGVVNAGISGNQVTSDTYDGQAARLRVPRDVLARTGVRAVIVLEGINDIQSDEITLATVTTLEDEYRSIAAEAHRAHLLVLGATLTPFGGSAGYSPAAEAVRERINDFIRHGGVFDRVIDLDLALRDPAAPTRLAAGYSAADHLHLNDAGYRRIGTAIPLADLR